jgi:hypothetical protein
MNNLYSFLKDKTTISESCYNNYKSFNYSSKESFFIDIQHLCKLKNIKIVEERTKRLSQDEFRNGLKKKYMQCIITGNNISECESAHIIPVKDDGNYELTNGLLLSANIHKTFDKFYWSINPITSCIEIKNNGIKSSINQYNGNKIDLEKETLLHLQYHYDKFKKIDH